MAGFGTTGGGYVTNDGERNVHLPRAQHYNLAADQSETKNFLLERHDVVAELIATMKELINEGYSTPGPAQVNDVSVIWKRFLNTDSAPKNTKPKKRKAR